MSDSPKKLASFDVKLELEIDAPPATVWKGFVEEVNDWWLPDFHICGPDSKMTLEPFSGGRFYETGKDGSHVLWGNVLHLVPEKLAVWTGVLSPDFGGPATAVLSFKIESKGSGTLASIAHSGFGQISEELTDQLEGGWKLLFQSGLKEHCEK